MSNFDSPEAFVDYYSTLLPESNASELQKVLEMSGMKRMDQIAIVQAYRLVRSESRKHIFRVKFGGTDPLAPVAPQLSASQALNAVVSMAADGLAESNSMKRLEKLVKRNL